MGMSGLYVKYAVMQHVVVASDASGFDRDLRLG
jgi:hypothetical protein